MCVKVQSFLERELFFRACDDDARHDKSLVTFVSVKSQFLHVISREGKIYNNSVRGAYYL